MSDDVRTRLRLADELVRQQRFREAVGLYQSVAEEYTALGFALKAVAISRSVVQIVDHSASDLPEERVRALRRLLDLYCALGLTEDAEQTRKLLHDAIAV